MAASGGGAPPEIHVDVVSRDGSTAATYRLAHPWERCADSTGAGAAAAASTEATASRAAVPAQAARLVARLVLTIVSAGKSSTMSLLPPSEASSAQGQGTSSVSIEIHPVHDRAVLRVFTVPGSCKKWTSTGFYTMCNFQQFSTDQVFGKETVHFDARRCEELTFPPFKLNFALHFNVLKEIGKGTEGKVSKCSSKFSEYTCAIKRDNTFTSSDSVNKF
ncbi:hypothetical protein ACQ4PT_038338 [Festuca glaucescens]